MNPDKGLEHGSPSSPSTEGVAAAPGQRARPEAHERSLTIHAAALYFQGPVPPPQVLGGYEELLPGAAERVFLMAEQQAAHRLRLEARGQAYGFAIAAVTVIGSFVLIAYDKSVLGVAAVIAAVAGLSGLFVWSKAKERDPSPSERRRGATGRSAQSDDDQGSPTGAG